MKLYIEQMPTEGRPVLVGDHTAWSRREAVTLKDRTIEHQPTPIVEQTNCCGHGFSTLAWIPETQGVGHYRCGMSG